MAHGKKKKPKAGFLSSIVGRMKKEVDLFKKNKPAYGNAANARNNVNKKRGY